MIFDQFLNQTVALGTPFCHYLLPLVPLEPHFPSGHIKIVPLFSFYGSMLLALQHLLVIDFLEGIGI